ncbi:hypothetical protein B566_EDAN017653 [Ephemera danica]|nr:hypothetical protein B566_EDAN017653 [Ephemera danica]
MSCPARKESRFNCDKCTGTYSSKECLYQHMMRHIRIEKAPVRCSNCNEVMPEKHLLKHKREECVNRDRVGGPVYIKPRRLPRGVRVAKTAFDKMLTNYEVDNTKETTDMVVFMETQRYTIREIIKHDLFVKNAIKMNLALQITIENVAGEVSPWAFRTSNVEIYLATPIDEIITDMFEKIKQKFSERLLDGSGCKLATIEKLLVRTSKNNPLRVSSYLKIPEKFKFHHALINPYNVNDNECFKWSVCASQHNGPHPERTTNLLQYINRFEWEGVRFPTAITDVRKFERINPKVSINLYALSTDDKFPEIFPIKVVEKEKDLHIDLLVLEHGDNRHFAYIKNFSRLISSQISNHNGFTLICKRCLSHHFNEEALTIHKKHCSTFPIAKVELPLTRVGEDGQPIKPIIEFKNVEHSEKVPIVVYVDFESYLPKVQGCTNNPEKSSTTVVQEHVPISYGFYVMSTLPPEVMTGIPLDYQTFEGKDAARHFLDALEDISRKVYKLYRRKEPMNLAREEWRDFHKATQCYICHKKFTEEDYKVRDHCHITGKYRGAAHTSCNLRAQNPHFIPIFAHNMSGYDSKFIINQLEHTPGPIHVVPNTEEKFIAFSKKPDDGLHLLFLDSLRFMSSGLDNLVKNLPKEKMTQLKKMFPNDKKRELMSRKGVFCYDYLDDLKKLKYTFLPPKEAFKNTLTDEHISDEDYAHAQNVWSVFKCKTLRDYLALYLKADVALLTDVFEEFRAVCLKAYGLDPCWYYTAPSLAWDAALKYTGVTLDLVQDLEIIEMVERGIRGGVAQCTKRFAVAKNKYTAEKPSPGFEPNYIAYLDANNLYGWAMSHALPTGNFKLVKLDYDEDEFKVEKLMAMRKDAPRGCIFEVDMEYPGQLHDSHSDFPFLPENKVPPGGKHTKLVTTLDEKKHYVIHYLALQQAIANGLKITKVHSVLEFDQSPFLKPYIDLNTEMRKKAANNFEKDFFKLMNNAVYGKTMENVRKRMDLELVTEPKRLAKCIASIYFKDRVIYTEKMTAIHYHKKKVVLDKPTYVGMAILDISKTLMYDFHYETMLPIYGNKLSLLYMDTDSFIYEIRTDDFYRDMQEFSHRMDTSDYPTNHPLYSETNKKVLGMFKDEANAAIVTKFVGLRAKMYCIEYGGKTTKKAKGVKTSALKKQITSDHYEQCLFNKDDFKYTSYRSIQSKFHQLRTVQQNKLSLSGYDDKRHIREDKVSTFAHGHYRILLDEVRAQIAAEEASAAAANTASDAEENEPMDVVSNMSSLRKNLLILRRLSKSKPKVRKEILKHADKELVRCICECAHNTIYNNVPVTEPQLKRLSRHKRMLRRLAKKGESWKKKKQTILHTIEKLKQNVTSKPSVETLDTEMSKVLHDKNLNVHDAWRQYEQMLQRYLSSVARSKEPIKIPLVENNDYGPPTMSDDIVQSMGNNPVLSRKAKLLMNLLSRSPYISWDESGRVMINNQLLHGSNIIDLLNDVLRNRKHSAPVGWEPFARVLASLNVPREFIHNEQRWEYIQSLIGKRHGAKRKFVFDDGFENKRRKTSHEHFPLPPLPDTSDDDDDYPDPSMTDDLSYPSITDDLSTPSLTDDDSSDYMTADSADEQPTRKRSNIGEIDSHSAKRGRVMKAKEFYDPYRRRLFGKKRNMTIPLFQHDGLYMHPPKRRRQLLSDGVRYTIKAAKRKNKSPIHREPSKRRRLQSVLAENLHDRRSRKRKVENLNWFNDKYLGVPRKKQKLSWERFRL